MEKVKEKLKVNNKETNRNSINKPYKKYYTHEQMSIEMPANTLYQYLFENNVNNLKNIAINYFGKKISFKKLFEKIDDCWV